MATDDEYNYPAFRRSMLAEDMTFQGGPRPGEAAPDFELPAVDGGRFRLRGALGRPVLLQFGSYT